MKKKIDDATAAELLGFARTHLGLEIDGRAGRAKVLAAIQSAGHEGDEITVAANDMTVIEGFGKLEPTPDELKGVERVRVVIPKSESGYAIDPVPVAVNGWAISIQRGKEVSIPKPHLDALLNAVEYRYMNDADGNVLSDPIEVPAYPVQVLGAA